MIVVPEARVWEVPPAPPLPRRSSLLQPNDGFREDPIRWSAGTFIVIFIIPQQARTCHHDDPSAIVNGVFIVDLAERMRLHQRRRVVENELALLEIFEVE